MRQLLLRWCLDMAEAIRNNGSAWFTEDEMYMEELKELIKDYPDGS